MSAWTQPIGWFACQSEGEAADGHYSWQPVLQGKGMQSAVDVWFATEADCIAFIKSDVIGHGLLADHSA